MNSADDCGKKELFIMKIEKPSKPNIFIFAGVLFLVFFLSELFYALNNKWVLYSYILKISKVLNKSGFTNTAFYLSTEFKYRMPSNSQFTQDVNGTYSSLPSYFNLPSYLYFFGVSAYKNNLPDLTPKLFELAIKMDPDFSYWRVELANYYFLQGRSDSGEETIVDCTRLQYPKKHCEDFMTTYKETRMVYDVGFLNEDVMNYYETHHP